MGEGEAEVKAHPTGLGGSSISLLETLVLELVLFHGTSFLPNILYKYPTVQHVCQLSSDQRLTVAVRRPGPQQLDSHQMMALLVTGTVKPTEGRV